MSVLVHSFRPQSFSVKDVPGALKSLFTTGAAAVDAKGLLLRFPNDLQLIASEEKKLMAICEYLRYLATQKGIGSVNIEDHNLAALMKQAQLPLCVWGFDFDRSFVFRLAVLLPRTQHCV